ncbi:MAG: PIN domain-containing protein [Caulobacteraceae bacterium]
MIAADTSSLIAYFGGERAADTDMIAGALEALELALPPPVLVELIGGDREPGAYDQIALHATLLPLKEGYWLRAREARRLILSKGLPARAIDSLTAQCCLDADVALITRDGDFRHFARCCGLKLALDAA